MDAASKPETQLWLASVLPIRSIENQYPEPNNDQPYNSLSNNRITSIIQD